MDKLEDNGAQAISGWSAELVKLTKWKNESKGLGAGSAIILLALILFIFRWQFGLLLILWIITHKYGHVWAMQRCGIGMKGIYFLPFFSTATVVEEPVISQKSKFFIAVMGPLWGILPIILAMGMFYGTKDRHYLNAANNLVFLSLITLLPISLFAGGRMLKAICLSIHPKLGMIIKALGVAVLGLLAIRSVNNNIIIYLLLLLGLLEFCAELSSYKEQRERDELASDIFETTGETYPAGALIAIPMSKLRIIASICVYLALFMFFSAASIYLILLPRVPSVMGVKYLI